MLNKKILKSINTIISMSLFGLCYEAAFTWKNIILLMIFVLLTKIHGYIEGQFKL